MKYQTLTIPFVSFHSISFPSEWGAAIIECLELKAKTIVSIQLVSPASGE